MGRSLGIAAGILLLAAWPRAAAADGLRIGTSLGAFQYRDAEQRSVSVFQGSVGARVSRGRAGMSFTVPVMGVVGGRVELNDQSLVVQGGEEGTRVGLSDMSVGLDYNLIQNRERMFLLTLGGSMRFPTAAAGLGVGEHLFGLSLSAVYGITRELLAFAEARHAWVGVLTPVHGRTKSGELGAIWWFTPSLGVTASAIAAGYGDRGEPSLEFNLGLSISSIPGLSMNVGGVGGLFGSAPVGGGSVGFGFEL